MKTLAAVLVETGKPLELGELEIPKLKPGQVIVEVEQSGMCQTQLLEARGYRGKDSYLPHCLGHEAIAVVREVGEGVAKVRLDERVIVSWMRGVGADAGGTVYRWNGQAVNAGPVTTFSRHAVVSESRLTPLPPSKLGREAAILGCAIATGMGAALNVANIRAGQSVVVFGAGGVGLCAVAGAAIAGASPLIVVDVDANKLSIAQQIGATQTLSATSGEVTEQIRQLCPGGVDVAIEATGRPAVMRQALACVRNRGGTAVVVGNARHGETLEIDPKEFNLGKRLLGTWGGDNEPDVDFPRYARLMHEKNISLAPLVERTYTLEETNLALSDLESGAAVRPILELRTA